MPASSLPHFAEMSLRARLIAIFIAIKVLPLLLLALFAWQAATDLGRLVTLRAVSMADVMLDTQRRTGATAIGDAIEALDDRAREAIEALTTDVAREVARFLYDRDQDILRAAGIPPAADAYRRFLDTHLRLLEEHAPYALDVDGTRWVEADPAPHRPALVRTPLPDNAGSFHYRTPDPRTHQTLRPLFLEMSFIDLDGHERVKVHSDRALGLLDPALRDIRDPAHTFVRAETYWPALQKLVPGEIHVSRVIGAQVHTHWIGEYTPHEARRQGKPFAPEASGYAGLENPVGVRFRGLVRWATPVVRDGQITGYVTLALDHAHIMAFTDTLRPTPERHAPIADPASGNYAFMWDDEGHNISHARDYFIHGFDPATGQHAVPWLDTELFNAWQASGLEWTHFAATVPAYRDQRLSREPHPESTASGQVGLDCRYLSFSPQCLGWHDMTEHGGSGSFVIEFSGLRKLTTVAAIPYHTGPYARSERGFGYVTIGANIDEFHRAATESGRRIGQMIDAADLQTRQARDKLVSDIRRTLRQTSAGLAVSTLIMAVAVILIAIWMANLLSRRITDVVDGIHRFEKGELDHRLTPHGRDELAELARSFNRMADTVRTSILDMDHARVSAEQSNRMKSEFLANMSHELRTPLNGIIGFADLLAAELESPEHRHFADTIGHSSRHLLAVLNDVLDLAKVEANRMRIHTETFDLCALLRSVAALHQVSAEAKRISLATRLPEAPCRITADPVRVRQIVENLVSNAIKFTLEGGVEITLTPGPEAVRLTVSDTGIGITAEELERIFDPFYQARPFLNRTHGGTGLGLTLSRRLAMMMGGEIHAISTPGHGARFDLHLPCQPPPHLPEENT